MAKKGTTGKFAVKPATAAPTVHAGRPSALPDTRVVYCRDNLEQLVRAHDKRGSFNHYDWSASRFCV